MIDPVLLMLSRKIRDSGQSYAELARETNLSSVTIRSVACCFHQPNSGTIAKLMKVFRLKIVDEQSPGGADLHNEVGR